MNFRFREASELIYQTSDSFLHHKISALLS